MSPQLSEGEEVSDTESANGAQAMSVSTPDDTSSDKNLNPEDDIQSDPDSTGPNVEDDLTDTQHDARSGTTTQPPGGQWIEPDPNSVVSDYSEMADPLKEHLANVQIIQKEDLEAGNTMCQNHFSVGQKIVRSPDETEEEFSKRLRKINYLSLAQEFAALKKIDADALPFDLLKGGQHDFSPMSETSSETDLTDGSNATTPMEAPALAPMGMPSVVTSGHVTARQKQVEVVNKLTDRFERAINPSKDAWVAPTPKDNNKKAVPGSTPQPDILNDIDDDLGDDLDGPDVESVTLVPARPDDRKSGGGGNGTEKLGDFDVYNIESTLPQLDWSMLEQQLHRAAEEERQKQQSRRNDREEIRRKLAMGVEEEYYGGERMYKKPNLQTRLQSGMNLQICFMNEATCDVDSVNGDDPASCKTLPAQDDNATPPTPKTTQGEVIPTKTTQALTDEKTAVDQRPTVVVDPVTGEVRPVGPRGKEEDEDFFAKQAKLQDEARMALAQVRPMAHMQLEVEKQMRKKSPIAEMVGIPALGAKKKFGRHLLSDMNVAQLQVVVNDLHSQIETLNEELVMMLVGRDDLHMEQDSMLVDIEDHHRRALEVAARVNKPKRTNKKK